MLLQCMRLFPLATPAFSHKHADSVSWLYIAHWCGIYVCVYVGVGVCVHQLECRLDCHAYLVTRVNKNKKAYSTKPLTLRMS